MNRENLAKLAAYLEKLPVDYRKFMMADFIQNAETKSILDVSAEYIRYISDPEYNICDTAACALGHAPQIGPEFRLTKEELENNLEDYNVWDVYCEKVFGISFHSPEGYWMFGGCWTHYDNSHRGAAARIRYLLAHGSPPKFWNEFGSEYMDFDDYELSLLPDEEAQKVVAIYQGYKVND